MNTEEALRLTAGVVVGISVLLAVFHSPNWLWLTGFVSLNLIQSAFTGSCPARWFYEKIGLSSCCSDKTEE